MGPVRWMSFALLFLSIFLGLAAGEDAELTEGLKRDAEALSAIKAGIVRDPSKALRNWEEDTNPCGWAGVECDPVVRGELEETRVVSLKLWGLDLEGSLSAEVGNLSELRNLVIVGNKLKGSIPKELRNCGKLRTVDLRANGFSGQIQFRLAHFPLLQVLMLSENQLSDTLDVLFAEEAKSFSSPFALRPDGSKPSGLCPRLVVLDLSQNSFKGRIPSKISACDQLLEVSLNDNSLSGQIPSSLGALSLLKFLYLDGNLLSGALPSTIAECRSLEILDVSANVLSGRIPTEFAKFEGVRQFNFSNNGFHGAIPLGKWHVQQMAMAGRFSNNPGLCGFPLARMCERSGVAVGEGRVAEGPSSPWGRFKARLHEVGKEMQESSGRSGFSKAFGARRSMAESDGSSASPAPSPASGRKKSDHRVRKWALGLALGIVVGAVAAALLATILRVCLFYMHKAPYLQGPIIFHPQINPKMLTFLEKDEALNEAEVIGVGAAGRVYKAKLETGMEVAVKSVVIKDDSKGNFGQRQIQAELETLGCIRHRNLVTLFAYIHRPDCHLLLYEYMENGSLNAVLNRVDAGELRLPWPVRHRIAVGTAEGLAYLHCHCDPRIVHRDLKPANILLDRAFVAHLADFGLAKVISGTDTHVTTDVAGTRGYIAPEYSQTCRFTDKSDVYSFGVVLAVLLTGKDPTHQLFHSAPGGNIGSWLHHLLQSGEGADAVDPRLRDTPEFEDEILLAMKIAVFCTSDNPNERPSSSDVLIMLNQIRPVEDVPPLPAPVE